MKSNDEPKKKDTEAETEEPQAPESLISPEEMRRKRDDLSKGIEEDLTTKGFHIPGPDEPDAR